MSDKDPAYQPEGSNERRPAYETVFNGTEPVQIDLTGDKAPHSEGLHEAYGLGSEYSPLAEVHIGYSANEWVPHAINREAQAGHILLARKTIGNEGDFRVAIVSLDTQGQAVMRADDDGEAVDEIVLPHPGDKFYHVVLGNGASSIYGRDRLSALGAERVTDDEVTIGYSADQVMILPVRQSERNPVAVVERLGETNGPIDTEREARLASYDERLVHFAEEHGLGERALEGSVITPEAVVETEARITTLDASIQQLRTRRSDADAQIGRVIAEFDRLAKLEATPAAERDDRLESQIEAGRDLIADMLESRIAGKITAAEMEQLKSDLEDRHELRKQLEQVGDTREDNNDEVDGDSVSDTMDIDHQRDLANFEHLGENIRAMAGSYPGRGEVAQLLTDIDRLSGDKQVELLQRFDNGEFEQDVYVSKATGAASVINKRLKQLEALGVSAEDIQAIRSAVRYRSGLFSKMYLNAEDK